MLSCLGGLPAAAAAVGSPVLFLAPTLLLVQVLACYHNQELENESRIESIFQSIVQSRVQLLHRPHVGQAVCPNMVEAHNSTILCMLGNFSEKGVQYEKHTV